MPAQPVIDGFEFARSAGEINGRCTMTDLGRLRDALVDSAVAVDYTIRGIRDAHGRDALELEIRGVLKLCCQRCLGVLEYPVAVKSRLVLAATQDEIDAAPYVEGEPDRVLAGKEMRVADLIEDELLLAMPLAPRHEHCGGRAAAVSDPGAASPFEGLRRLMQDTNAQRTRRH